MGWLSFRRLLVILCLIQVMFVKLDLELPFIVLMAVMAIVMFLIGAWNLFYLLPFLRGNHVKNIRDVKPGKLGVIGTAKKSAKIIAPFSGTECVFYVYTIEREDSIPFLDWFLRNGPNWFRIARGSSDSYPIRLQDSTGDLLVFPKGVTINFSARWELESKVNANDFPERIKAFITENQIKTKGVLGDYVLRFREYFILPDEQIFVFGTAGLRSKEAFNFPEPNKVSGNVSVIPFALNGVSDGSVKVPYLYHPGSAVISGGEGLTGTSGSRVMCLWKDGRLSPFFMAMNNHEDLIKKLRQGGILGIVLGVVLFFAFTHFLTLFRNQNTFGWVP